MKLPRNIFNLFALLVAVQLKAALCSGSCCGTLRVIQKDNSDTAARDSQPGVFTNYTIGMDLVNDRVHYTSQDGAYAIAFHEDHGGQWFIQPVEKK